MIGSNRQKNEPLNNGAQNQRSNEMSHRVLRWLFLRKNKLLPFSKEYPKLCELTNDNQCG